MEQNEKKIEDSGLNLKELLFACLNKWYLFVISLAVCLGIGYYYTLKTPNLYERRAQLLIKDDRYGGTKSGDVGASFVGMSVFQGKTNVMNEAVAITSPVLMYEVVDRLDLDVSYAVDGTFRDKPLYGWNLPVQLRFLDLGDYDRTSMTMNVNPDGSGTLSDIVVSYDEDGKPVYDKKTVKFAAGIDTINTPVGRIVVRPNASFKGENRSAKDVRVRRVSKTGVAKSLAGRVTTDVSDDRSSIINLSYQDLSAQRADDVLNAVIEAYNENWIRDKNQIAVSTSNFIDERLRVIEKELGSVDSDISSYRSEHLIPDVQSVAQTYFMRTTEASDEVQNISNRLAVANYVRDFLNNSANNSNVLPANLGITDIRIESQINEYNNKLLQRNNLLQYSSASNPLVSTLENELSALRSAIITSIDNYVATLKTSLKTAQSSRAASASQLAANPTQAKYLLSVERQQKVKESLYLFLLQKREENELSQAFTAYNTRIIAPPTGSDAPVSPDRRKIMLIAFMIGLAIPVALIYLSEMFNTKVRGRRDLEGLSMPLAGEVPQAGKRRKGFARLFGRYYKNVDRAILVKKGKNNLINEAFRVVRTNLEFIAESEHINQDPGKGRVIMITSANAGSGKTFVTLNLGAVFAIKNKRVCMIDLDLRRASLSKSVSAPNKGITSYLIGQATLDDIMMHDIDGCEGLDLIPVGAMPPNPSELLYSSRLKALIDQLRDEYDYIIVDCPPVEVVADARIITSLVDMTIFIVRAGMFERELLKDVQEFHDTKSYRNMIVLLNGTDTTSLVSVRSRYGYGYGYGYGYRAGYGYGED